MRAERAGSRRETTTRTTTRVKRKPRILGRFDEARHDAEQNAEPRERAFQEDKRKKEASTPSSLATPEEPMVVVAACTRRSCKTRDGGVSMGLKRDLPGRCRKGIDHLKRNLHGLVMRNVRGWANRSPTTQASRANERVAASKSKADVATERAALRAKSKADAAATRAALEDLLKAEREQRWANVRPRASSCKPQVSSFIDSVSPAVEPTIDPALGKLLSTVSHSTGSDASVTKPSITGAAVTEPVDGALMCSTRGGGKVCEADQVVPARPALGDVSNRSEHGVGKTVRFFLSQGKMSCKPAIKSMSDADPTTDVSNRSDAKPTAVDKPITGAPFVKLRTTAPLSAEDGVGKTACFFLSQGKMSCKPAIKSMSDASVTKRSEGDNMCYLRSVCKEMFAGARLDDSCDPIVQMVRCDFEKNKSASDFQSFVRDWPEGTRNTERVYGWVLTWAKDNVDEEYTTTTAPNGKRQKVHRYIIGSKHEFLKFLERAGRKDSRTGCYPTPRNVFMKLAALALNLTICITMCTDNTPSCWQYPGQDAQATTVGINVLQAKESNPTVQHAVPSTLALWNEDDVEWFNIVGCSGGINGTRVDGCVGGPRRIRKPSRKELESRLVDDAALGTGRPSADALMLNVATSMRRAEAPSRALPHALAPPAHTLTHVDARMHAHARRLCSTHPNGGGGRARAARWRRCGAARGGATRLRRASQRRDAVP